METLSGGRRNLPAAGGPGTPLRAHLEVLDAVPQGMGPHLLTGPVHVEGARPGDRLIVEIDSVELAQDYGWNAIEPGFGVFPDLAGEYASLTVPIDRARATAQLPWGPELALAPFFGILAVAPEGGPAGSVVPGPFGGNMDNRYCRAGARIAFPVFREGALFYAGDGHARQGDGEICDTALETALTGRFRFLLEPGTAPEAPEITHGTLAVTMDFDPDLNRAAETAARRMIDRLQAECGLSRQEAYRHCSLCADLRITQLVNRSKGVHCVLDLATLR